MRLQFTIRAYKSSDFEVLDAIRAQAFAPIFSSFRALLREAIAGIALANAEGEQQALLRSL